MVTLFVVRMSRPFNGERITGVGENTKSRKTKVDLYLNAHKNINAEWISGPHEEIEQ